MNQMRNLKRRIASIETTAHIAQGMKLVSTAKLKTAQDRVFAARPFARLIAQVMNDLASLSPQNHPYFRWREVERLGLWCSRLIGACAALSTTRLCASLWSIFLMQKYQWM